MKAAAIRSRRSPLRYHRYRLSFTRGRRGGEIYEKFAALENRRTGVKRLFFVA